MCTPTSREQQYTWSLYPVILSSIYHLILSSQLILFSSPLATVAGSGVEGYNGDNIDPLTADLNFPVGILVDNDKNIYFADKNNHRVRMINITENKIYTVAGNGETGYNGDSQPATEASLFYPYGVVIGIHGNLIVTDKNNNRIRKIDLKTGLISTIAGTGGGGGYNGENIPALEAAINLPKDVSVDLAGNIYFTDKFNNLVRKIDITTGIIINMAGNGTYGFNGDDIPATSAYLRYPTGMVIDDEGNVFFADKNNNRVRFVNITTGLIHTCAGNGNYGFSGDGEQAVNALMFSPYGVAGDLHGREKGNLYFSDKNNNRIRMVDMKSGIITTVAGTGHAPTQKGEQPIEV
jgi:sugar lactone lactonase YvrE